MATICQRVLRVRTLANLTKPSLSSNVRQFSEAWVAGSCIDRKLLPMFQLCKEQILTTL